MPHGRGPRSRDAARALVSLACVWARVPFSWKSPLKSSAAGHLCTCRPSTFSNLGSSAQLGIPLSGSRAELEPWTDSSCVSQTCGRWGFATQEITPRTGTRRLAKCWSSGRTSVVPALQDVFDVFRVWGPADLVCFSVPLWLRLPVRHATAPVLSAFIPG